MEKKRILKLVLALLMVFCSADVLTTDADSAVQDKVRILLIGDSTTAGGKPEFENSIEQLFAGIENIPDVEVVNAGLGGETAYSILNSGRYESQIREIDSVDYIFVRYGINDWIHRKPFMENFPADMQKLITQLRKDFPESEIILMTILPFLSEPDTKVVNEYITRVSAEENLRLFDIYTPYKKQVDEFGRNSLTVRFFPLTDIPEKYHELVAPFAKYYSWKDAVWVRVQSNEFDPLFGHLPGWYKDSHPNTTGYRLIADETVKYILPLLQGNKR